jgi:aminopeptidase N
MVVSSVKFIPSLAGSNDPAMIDKLNAYAKAYLTPESRKPVDQAIVSIETRIKTQPRVRSEVSAWLDAK